MNRIILLIISLFFLSWLDPYRDAVTEGNKQFKEKKYKEAGEKYQNASKYAPSENEKNKLRFNEGDAEYMKTDYDAAIENFRKSLKSENKNVQKKAFFNMGNTYLKKGEVGEAVNSFISALKIDPNYAAAKKNLEYILKKKQDDKNKNGNKDSDKKDQNKKDDDKSAAKDKNKKDDKDAGEKKNANMSKEQVMNILNSMKNKPVRREKGKGDGERYLEKSW
jgi:Ca-activated chloride channel homolog